MLNFHSCHSIFDSVDNDFIRLKLFYQLLRHTQFQFTCRVCIECKILDEHCVNITNQLLYHIIEPTQTIFPS